MSNLPHNGHLLLTGAGMQATAAVLKIGTLHLMLKQSEMRSLESISDLDSNNNDNCSVGWVTYAQQHWPAYCLSSELELQASVPAARRACVLLALERGYIGVLCDDLTLIKQMDVQVYELPWVMRRHDMPINGVVSYNQNIACVSDANSLAAHIKHKTQCLLSAKGD